MQKRIETNKEIITIFISTFLFGYLAHGYIFLNGIFSHDATRIFQNDFSFQISLGRYLQPLYLWFRGYISMPFLIGIISLFFLSMAICFIQKVFHLKKKSSLILLCAVLTVNATFSLGNASYMPWTDIYMVAFFLASFGVYCYVNGGRFGWLFAVVSIALCVGLYQPYFATAIALFMIYAVKQIFDDVNYKEIFLNGIKMIAVLMLALLVYYLGLRAVLNMTGIALSSGSNSIQGVGNYSDVSIFGLVLDTYKYFLKTFLKPVTYHHNVCGMLNVLIFLLSIILICYHFYTEKIEKKSIFLFILIIFLFPFGMNAIYFISKGSVHELVIYAFYLIYFFVIYVMEKDMDNSFVNAAKKGIIFCLSFLLFNNLIFSNQLYLKKDLEYKSTLSLMTRVIDRLEQTDGYEPGSTPVAFIGIPSSLSFDRYGYGEIRGIGISDFGTYSITYDLTYYWFLTDVLGYPIQIVSEYEYKYLDEVKEMPIFPAKDSIVEVDGTIVVKFS